MVAKGLDLPRSARSAENQRFFGKGVLDWETLSQAVDLVDHIAHTFIAQLETSQNTIRKDLTDKLIPLYDSGFANFMVTARKDRQNQPIENVLKLLDHARTCSVTDPRDRVFAFIGLANPGYGILPDYSVDAPTIFRLACKRIILYDNSLSILGCCDKVHRDSPRKEDIPSWTPDLFSGGVCSGLIYDPVSDFPAFRASAAYQSAAAFHPINGLLDGVLRVQCLFIDHLAIPGSLSSICASDSRQEISNWRRIAGAVDNGEALDYFINPSISTDTAFYNVVCRGCNFTGDESIPYLARKFSDSTESGLFFRSPKGYFGLTKRHANPQYSDLICVLLGANIPFILRKRDNFFVVISDAYVEGLMFGEAIELMRQGDLTVETIDLI